MIIFKDLKEKKIFHTSEIEISLNWSKKHVKHEDGLSDAKGSKVLRWAGWEREETCNF